MAESNADVPLPMRLSRMIMSAWVPQTIYSATALGLPDELGEGRKHSEDIARAVGAPAGNVHRLLRALVMLELCREVEPGLFELTDLGGYLRTDAPDSMKNWALLWGRPNIWAGWGRLLDAIKTGQTASELIAGKGTFEWMQEDAEGLEIFNQSMKELTSRVGRAVVHVYDFSGLRRIVDVGGGYGTLLAAILESSPDATGIVFDLAHCREGAERLLAEKGLANRAEFVAGDFFDSVAAGADAYVMKSVIHDWNDEKSVAILTKCREAMTPKSRLLMLEPIAPEKIGMSPFDLMMTASDLNMLLMTGGCERTERQYRALLERAGLTTTRVVTTPSPMSIFESRIS